jgi:AraC-like DNA-binding protein
MLPQIFEGDINVVRIASVTSEESKLDMNYFFDRPYHALIYKVSGTMVCYYRDRTVEFSSNDIVYIPKGMTYRSRLKSEGKYIIINFDTAENYSADEIFVARFENHSNLYSLFSKCAEEWLFKDTAHLLNCKSYVYKILALMARALDGRDAETRKRIAPSIEYLHRHINDPSLDTSSAAKASGLSETQFRRLFKKLYIVAPSRYIISVRIGQAKDLLLSERSSPFSASIADIAHTVGFTDVESFTKLFRREVGMTPGEFRDGGKTKVIKRGEANGHKS